MWREKWPHPPPTTEDVQKAGGDVEKATIQKNEAIEKSNILWLYNHARRDFDDSGNVKQNRGVIKLGVKPDTGRLFFAFSNKFIKKKFEAVTDPEVLERVEKYRQDEKSRAVNDELKSANRLKQANIDKVGRTVIEFCEKIREATGWNISVIAGGSEPRDGGSLSTVFHHAPGTTASGKNFSAWLGNKHATSFLTPYNHFLYEAFPADVRAMCALKQEGSKSHSTSSDREDDSEDDSDVSYDTSGEEDEGKKAAVDSASSSSNKSGSAPSSYALERAENMKKLNLLLEQRGLFPKPKPPLAKVPRKPKPAVDNPASVRRSSRISNTSTADPALTKPTSPTEAIPDAPNDANKGPENSETMQERDDIEVEDEQEREQEPDFEGEKDGNTEEIDGNGKEDDGPANKETAKSGSLHSLNSNITSDQDQISSSLCQQSTEPTNNSLPDNNSLQNVATSGGNKPGSTLSHQGARLSPSLDKSELLDDGEFKNCPDWMQPTLSYLRETSLNVAWQRLIIDLIIFENAGPLRKQLSTTSRPDEVKTWAKRHKPLKSTPIAVDPATYSVSFKAWWQELQLSWRVTGDLSSYSRTVPEGERWESLCKGGNSGLYTVVMALSWWMRSDAASREAWAHQENTRTSWTTEDEAKKERRRAEWEAARVVQEEAERVAREDAVLKAAAEKEEADAAEKELKKKYKGKFLPINVGIPMPERPPIFLPPSILQRLVRGEYVELWYFTDQGYNASAQTIHSAQDKTFTYTRDEDGYLQVVSAASLKTPKTPVLEHEKL
ncbi:hypothetical protein CVT24_004204, partial [Panaeolus cyanescens]